MKYRTIGTDPKTSREVSVLSLGTMTFGGVGKFKSVGSLDVSEARDVVDCQSDPVPVVDSDRRDGAIAEAAVCISFSKPVNSSFASERSRLSIRAESAITWSRSFCCASERN